MNKKLLLGAMVVSIVTPSMVATADLVSADENELELDKQELGQEELVPITLSKEEIKIEELRDYLKFDTFDIIKYRTIELEVKEEYFKEYKELNLYLLSGSNIKKSVTIVKGGKYKLDLSQFDLADGVKIVSESITEKEKTVLLQDDYSIDTNRDIRDLLIAKVPHSNEYEETEFRGNLRLTFEKMNTYMDMIDTYNKNLTTNIDNGNKPTEVETKPEDTVKEETKEDTTPKNDLESNAKEDTIDKNINTQPNIVKDNVNYTSTVVDGNLGTIYTLDSDLDTVVKLLTNNEEVKLTSSLAKKVIDKKLSLIMVDDGLNNGGKKIKENVYIYPDTAKEPTIDCDSIDKVDFVIGDPDYSNVVFNGTSLDTDSDGFACEGEGENRNKDYYTNIEKTNVLEQPTESGQEMLPQTNTTKSSAYGMGIGAMLLGIGGALGIRRNKKQDTLN